MSSKQTFGERVIAARTKREWTRAKLSFVLHDRTCKVNHPEPYVKRDWSAACQKKADEAYKQLTAIEAGKQEDSPVAAIVCDILSLDTHKAPKPAPKQTRKPKAEQPAEATPEVEAETPTLELVTTS
jgi:hypothetical protein